MPDKKTPKVSLSIRIDEGLKKRLEALAVEKEWTVSYYAEKALEAYVELNEGKIPEEMFDEYYKLGWRG